MSEIMQYIEMALPYVTIVMPWVLGLLASFSVTRSIRLYRAEEGKTTLKDWQLICISSSIAAVSTTILWLTMADGTVGDALTYGLINGAASPITWKIILDVLRRFAPDSALLKTIHPKVKK